MDNDLLFSILSIVLFLLISAFFSASETALTAVSRARLYQLVMDGNRRAELVSKLRREKESLIGAILLGNNIVNIAASAIATSVSIKLVGNSGDGLLYVTLIMTLLVVIFSEILPKTYAIQNSETVALTVSPALNILVKLFYPITRTIQFFIQRSLRLFGIDITKTNTLISGTDFLRGTIELHHREGRMIKQDRDMLGSILDLNDIEVQHVMIHRKDMEALNADLPPKEFIRQAVGMGHSRIPVWRDSPDNIIGVLLVKNLIKAINLHGETLDSEKILALMNKPWFIPDTTSLRGQLLAFRSRKQHFAIVVDEYGALLGIVTLEDIIEEIVGHIEDEHDEARSDIRKVGDDSYIVKGSVTIRDINRELDWNLPDDHASTIAGLLIHDTETIPAIGEHYELYGVRMTVLDRTRSQITRIQLERVVAQAEYPVEE